MGRLCLSISSNLMFVVVLDVMMERTEEEKVLEDLKKELKAKHRELYSWQIELCRNMYEGNKMDFTRTMDKAWFTNEIIKERFRVSDLTTVTETPVLLGDIIRKARAFNKAITSVVSLGLDGLMFGPSKKEEEEEDSKEELEELRDLKILHEEIILQIVETDRGKMREKCKIRYRRARPFAKLEAREKCLSSIAKSLLKREAREPVLPTELEILGYLLLEEKATSTLQHPYIFFPHFTPKIHEFRNSITLASIGLEQHEAPPKIQVSIHPTLYIVSDKLSFETLLALQYDSLLTEAKSASNNSETEQMKWMLAKVEEQMKGKEVFQDIFPYLLNKMAIERSFESRLVVYCEDLSDMRYGRCLSQFSETETKRLEEIRHLASKAIDKYRLAKGPKSVPIITEPVLPSFRTRL